METLSLKRLGGKYSIHRFERSADIPAAVFSSDFYSISKTNEELSVVCPGSLKLNSEHCSPGWVCIKVVGPLDLNLTGILAKLSSILANVKISVFALSTYDTDYILIKRTKIDAAIEALKAAGYTFQ